MFFLNQDYDMFLRAAVLIASVVASYWILPFLYGLFISPTKNIPGPLLARVTRLFEYFAVLKGDSHLEYVRLHERFGPIVRIAPNRYSFSEPSDVKTIYELGGKFIKTEYYNPLLAVKQDEQNIFTIRDPNLHKERKRKIANLYSMSTMRSYEDAVDRMNTMCVQKLTQFTESKQKISLPDFMQYYAFDVIGEITFKQSYKMMQNEGDTTGMIKGIHAANNYLAYIGLVSELHPWITRLQTLKGNKSGSGTFFQNTLDQIAATRAATGEDSKEQTYESFLDKLLRLERGAKVGIPNIMDSCGSNLGAGSDTTAISLSAALYYLYRNPETLAALRHEIDTMASQGLISDPITFQEAQQMPYLQAVIKETLRVHPAVGTILPRMVPKGGMTLGGTFFPEGTGVGANAWVLHYSKEIFGDDAAVYKPERWLQPKVENDVRESMMFAFGGGSRTCLGKNISLLEITKVVPQIARKFDITFESESEAETKCAWFVYMKYNVSIKLRHT